MTPQTKIYLLTKFSYPLWLGWRNVSDDDTAEQNSEKSGSAAAVTAVKCFYLSRAAVPVSDTCDKKLVTVCNMTSVTSQTG